MVGVAPKEILSLVFNPVSLKILDFYLEMWLWWPHMCGKNPSLGSGYIRFREHRDFRIYVYFYFHIITTIVNSIIVTTITIVIIDDNILINQIGFARLLAQLL